jgi:hypothetical protein
MFQSPHSCHQIIGVLRLGLGVMQMQLDPGTILTRLTTMDQFNVAFLQKGASGVGGQRC